MSDHRINLALLILGIPVAIAAIIVIYDRLRAWREGKAVAATLPARPVALWLFNLIGIAALGLAAWNIWGGAPQSPLGFNNGWPDAIKCDATMPENTGSSPLIFYSQGITTARSPFGDVMRYFLVGGRNITDPNRFPLSKKDGGYPLHVGYFMHQIWFGLKNKELIDPTRYQLDQLDYVSQQYRIGWVEANCGGSKLQEIIAAGNAFTFAQPMK
jgi:hypothetical protein